ncbi:hypothetical protein PILCRDRAFT_828915 [Piloderma croceum F 1598]|uniref:Uncharacterized protein n=1 Tax=Piloderma croceum (strain F 1598) TaxID=765440 RepID=A0A0C3F194_PILCF|nr:hypothetical protein PILCRDRAFT_828915 [Piloderma croceum F 1598]
MGRHQLPYNLKVTLKGVVRPRSYQPSGCDDKSRLVLRQMVLHRLCARNKRFIRV